MDGHLVGSAEQSFLHLALNGMLKAGRYVAASPCFRDDPPDRFHRRTFFKVELIDLYAAGSEGLRQTPLYMAHTALRLFRALPGGEQAKIVPTGEDTYDIELRGVELGSYGTRSYDRWSWVYGTGLAEPRFTLAVQSEPASPSD